ncbi:hypothetical protein McpSp1_09050 [Methanocorpusculaceae archaeon Sp1]|nr:hypothetical protein [Methanocorpusculaceae archaeon Sp1]
MIPKGDYKISIRKSTDVRLRRIKQMMIQTDPDTYDETTSYNAVVMWMISQLRDHQIIP